MICIIVPSRGRPDRAAKMRASVFGTAAEQVRVIVAVDEDDPTLDAYHATVGNVTVVPHQGYTGTLNRIAREIWDEADILGAFGDDVILRTPGWDRIVAATLSTPGIAFGDDLIHGANHPTAVFMSSVIAKSLGWLALPATTHQWADDGWKRLGQDTGTLRFMPDVIVEHMHPAVDKAEWDDTYAEVFNDERAKSDYEGFQAWLIDGLATDAEKVRAAL